jgi:ribosomal-protein-alanine N-acetyltransferase
MQVEIGDASAIGLDELYSIEFTCFGKEAFTKQQIAYLLTDYNSIGLTAKIDGEIAGFIIASIYAEKKSLAGHILTIDVVPQYRRKGVGSSLMKAVEDIFRKKNVRTSHLEVREDNSTAVKLYEKLGYRKIGKLKNYYGNANGIYLAKKL